MAFDTFTGQEYVKIDIANNYGLDKLTWHERIRWFDQHEQQLDELLASAKEPALFYAGVKAYRDVLAGKPIGYMISLDATSSGLQLLAALTGDRSAAQLCNVVDTGTRQDAYDAIYRIRLGAAVGLVVGPLLRLQQTPPQAPASSVASPRGRSRAGTPPSPAASPVASPPESPTSPISLLWKAASSSTPISRSPTPTASTSASFTA